MTKISATAYIIAAGLAKLAEMPRWKDFFSEDVLSEESVSLNRVFMRQGRDSLVKRLVSVLPRRLMTGLMDRLYVPGMTEHYLFRKRWIESHVRAGLDRGVRQVILLGAGLDTLALRMAKQWPAARFFEIDLPATQRAKLAILRREGYAFPGNCRFEAADLGEASLAAVLGADPYFDPIAPTMVILEGVLMYLTESDVKRLLSELGSLFTGSLQIVYGALVVPDCDSDPLRRFTRFLLRRGAEETKWHCLASAMPGFMEELGFRMVENISYKALQRRYRSVIEIAQVPEHDEDYFIVAKLAQGKSNDAGSPISQHS
jgi:methyltransferase (TIGR00027 family)